MAHLKIQSSNPDLSFILKKNPASGMQALLHKQGVLMGWYNPNNLSDYHVFFKDKGNSYNESGDYNDHLSLTSPLFVLDSISEFFNENLKKHHEKDLEGFENQISVNAVSFANQKILSSFSTFFPEVNLLYTDGHIKTITLKTSKSIHYLMNYTALLFSMIELRKTELYVDSSLLIKYLHCLNRIDAPYFIRYLFKSHLLRYPEDFKASVDLLNSQGKYNFTPGDNYMSRVRAVESYLNSDPLADIGCGEGRFMSLLGKKVSKYLAYDQSEEERLKARNRMVRLDLPHIQLFDTNEDFSVALQDQPSFQGMLVEVVEHMPKPTAENLIKTYLQKSNLSQLFISTPDHAFNKHYAIDGYRHHDHHFELTMEEFKNWILSLTPPEFKANFLKIGDEIDGVSTTIGVVLKRNTSVSK